MKSILHVSRTLRYGIAFPMIFFFDDETFIQSYIDFPSMLSTSPNFTNNSFAKTSQTIITNDCFITCNYTKLNNILVVEMIFSLCDL